MSTRIPGGLARHLYKWANTSRFKLTDGSMWERPVLQPLIVSMEICWPPELRRLVCLEDMANEMQYAGLSGLNRMQSVHVFHSPFAGVTVQQMLWVMVSRLWTTNREAIVAWGCFTVPLREMLALTEAEFQAESVLAGLVH